MISKGRPSITAGGGVGTPNTTANRTNTSLRQRGGGQQATTCRDGLALLRSSQLGKQMGLNTNRSDAMLRNTQNNTERGGYIKVYRGKTINREAPIK